MLPWGAGDCQPLSFNRSDQLHNPINTATEDQIQDVLPEILAAIFEASISSLPSTEGPDGQGEQSKPFKILVSHVCC